MTVRRIGMTCLAGWLFAVMARIAMAMTGTDPPAAFGLLSSLLFWGIFAPLLYDWSRSRTVTEDRALFLLELADLVTLNIPVDQALAKIVDVRSRVYGHRFSNFTAVLSQVAQRVSTGHSLAGALRETKGVPAHWGSYVDCGQSPDALASLLRELARTERSNLRLPFLSALRIQLMVPLYIAIVTFLSTYIMPTFVELFRGVGVRLPWSTRLVLSVTGSSGATAVWILLGLLALLVLLAVPFEGVRRLLGPFLLHVPGLKGLLRLESQRRIFLLLGAGLRHGMPLSEALQTASCGVNLSAYQKLLRQASTGSGAVLSQHLASAPELFDESFVWLIQQGEALENLPESLLTAADLANVELERRSHRLATTLDTLVLVVIGVFVGVAVVGVFLPLYQLLGSLA